MKTLKCLLVFFMLIALCSCSDNNDDKKAIIIGGSGPLNGGAAQYGIAVRNGAQLAIDEINALNGLQFRLDFQDDSHDPEKAVNCYGVLKDDGMQISIGTVTSDPGAAVSPLYYEDHIFAITPSGSSFAVIRRDLNDETSYFGNVMQMCFTDPSQGTLSAQYIDENKLANRIAIIYKSDEAYSVGIYDRFLAEARSRNLNIVSVSSFDSSSASNFSVAINEARDAQADLVFLPIYFEPASLILQQSNSIGYNPIFFGVDGMDGILNIENFDKSLAEGVYLLTPFSADSTDELTHNFVKNYQDRYNSIPMQFAADGYDTIYAIYQACVNGNVTYDMSAQEICDIMVQQFTSMSFVGTTGAATWSKSGEVSKSPKAVIIKDGKYVSADN